MKFPDNWKKVVSPKQALLVLKSVTGTGFMTTVTVSFIITVQLATGLLARTEYCPGAVKAPKFSTWLSVPARITGGNKGWLFRSSS